MYNRNSLSEELAARLAELDERRQENTHAGNDPTLAELRQELEGVLADLRQVEPADPFESEPACRNATHKAQSLAADASSGPGISRDAGQERREPRAELPLGTLGQYELLAKLGEGGMGAVYKARHTRLDKIVALKVLPAERTRDKSAVARFEREMRAVGKLDHPNIVRAMDAGEAGGMHFLVMEYVEGIDLSKLVRACGPLPLAEACELVRQAAIGLDEAHEQGMVHRDIKPSNLMLCQSGKGGSKRTAPRVKILDLGLALLSEAHSPEALNLTGSGQMMGTLDYMAPEQGGDSHVVDIRADIYSLGATLYKLLTGEAIYHGPQFQTPVQKLMAVATLPAPGIRSRRADVPDALATIVHRMLAKEPARRLATPKEVADALMPFCEGADLASLLATALSTDAAKEAALTATHAPAISGEAPDVGSPDARSQDARSPDAGSKALQCLEQELAVQTVTQAAEVAESDAAQGTEVPYYEQGRHGTPGPHNERNRRQIVAAVVLGGLAVLLAGIVLYWQTPQGTVRIEINDDQLTARIDRQGVEFKKGGQETIRVEPGEYGLLITRGDLQFQTDKFVLGKRDNISLKIEFIDGRVAVRRDGKHSIAVKPLSPNAVEPAASNLALHFEPGDRVEIPSLKLDRNGPLTFELFVRPDHDQFTDFADLLGVRNQIDMYIDHSSSNVRFAVRFEPNQPHAMGAVPLPPLRKTTTHPKGRLVHMAAVRDKKELRLYMDGKRIGSAAVQDLPLVETELPFFIGGRQFSGRIDEVRISNIARYQADFTPKPRLEPDAHTLALYHCDEGTGRELLDASHRGHHGRILGARWTPSSGTSPLAARPRTDNQPYGGGAPFKPLFNGKDLAGWKYFEGIDHKLWQVEEGHLVGRGRGEGAIPILHSARGDYSNFHLRAEARISDGGRSGICYRTPFVPAFPPCYNFPINVNHADPQKTGSLTGFKPVEAAPHQVEEWVTLEIIADGARLIHKVDGKTVVDLEDSRFTQGHITLWLTDGTVIRFRKLEIRELPATSGPRIESGAPQENNALAPALHSLRREQIPAAALKIAGGGDAAKAPSGLVGVLGQAQPVQSGPTCLAFSPDGRWLATGSADKSLFLRDPDTGEVRHELPGHTGAVIAVAFSRDNKLVSASRDGTLRLWSLDDPGAAPKTIVADLGQLAAMAMSGDGRYLAACAGDMVKLWPWGNWNAAIEKRAGGRITAIALSPDGEQLALASDEQQPERSIALHKTSNGSLLHAWPAHSGPIVALAFSHNGSRLASSGNRSLKVWNIETRESVFEYANWTDLRALAFDPEDKQLFAGLGGQVGILFDLATKKEVRHILGQRGHFTAAAFRTDGRKLAIGASTGFVQTWDVDTWTPLVVPLGHSHHVGRVAISPNGQTVLTTGDDYTLRRWDLARPGENLVVQQFDRSVGDICFSPDGSKFATVAAFDWFDASRRGEVWDAASGQRLFMVDFPAQSCPGVAFSPDGRSIAGCGHGEGACIFLWDAHSGKLLHRFPKTGV